MIMFASICTLLACVWIPGVCSIRVFDQSVHANNLTSLISYLNTFMIEPTQRCLHIMEVLLYNVEAANLELINKALQNID